MNIEDFRVEKLGECRIANPITKADFIADESRVAYSSNTVELASYVKSDEEIPSFEAAGIRSKIFHDPTWSKAAIITAMPSSERLHSMTRARFRQPVILLFITNLSMYFSAMVM